MGTLGSIEKKGILLLKMKINRLVVILKESDLSGSFFMQSLWRINN